MIVFVGISGLKCAHICIYALLLEAASQRSPLTYCCSICRTYTILYCSILGILQMHRQFQISEYVWINYVDVFPQNCNETHHHSPDVRGVRKCVPLIDGKRCE